MIRNRLLQSVRFPYYVVKGSFEQRQYKAEQFTHRVVSNISGQLDARGISLSKLGRILKNLLPENFVVFVRKNKGLNAGAQFNRIFDGNNNIIKQSLELTPNPQNRINYLHTPSLAHEVRHMADSIFHPKILMREQVLAKKCLDTSRYTDFYDNQVYVREIFNGKKDKKRIIKDIKHKTTKILRGLTREDKIDLLQSMRYNLISERNAYHQSKKYAKKLYKNNMFVYEDELYDQTKLYMFDEKIELYKNVIYNLIKKERSMHRTKLKKVSNPIKKK